jgi:uncharacterized protein YecE (DUF72 family)
MLNPPKTINDVVPAFDPGSRAVVLRIGTAGWAIPRDHAQSFPTEGSGLTRYSAVFNATEINSTFYRSHRTSTFQRWHDTVPDGFCFSVKVPKIISHELRLVEAGRAFGDFASSLAGLGRKLGPLLLQLPPKLAYQEDVVRAFLESVKLEGPWELVVEPRHETWFGADPEALLRAYGVARVGADPERVPHALSPGGSRALTYLRLHGSPRVYFSSYDDAAIDAACVQLHKAPGPAWCIFDNTASGAAAGDALRLLALTET